jgi:septum site-determining protein MinC
MSSASISFKGTREGLHISLGEGTWHDLLNELALQLDRPGAQSFFQGARVLLETGERALGVVELEELIALLAQYGMTLSSVLGEAQAQAAFDQLRASMSAAPESLAPGNGNTPAGDHPTPDESTALLIRRTVRSGQRVHYAGTVVIFGDVNPGAEVIAEGDVIVWGKLRGVVHAGASGDESAMVGALILAPTQLRIGGQIARAPDERHSRNSPAEIARVRGGQIVVEPWSSQ